MRQARPFLAGVESSRLNAALEALERRRFAEGAMILAEGDYRGEMYVLARGRADVVLVDRNGDEHVVNTIDAGEAIGEMSLLTQTPASASVRAAEDVELIVVEGPDLDGLLDEFPQLQRNLIATLSARLARATRFALHERAGRLVVLEDAGGPDVLGYALTASVAWHTRGRALHVLLGSPPSGQLASLPSLAPEPPVQANRAAGADLMIAELDGHFGVDRIEATLDVLTRVYDHVVLQVPQTWRRRPGGERIVRLTAFGASGGKLAVEPHVDGREHAVEVPALAPSELASLERGLLPVQGAAGIAIGRVARELANLSVGVALGSGSIRGYAHVGALRALERHGIPVDYIAGTSIGATVAGAYAHLRDVDRVGEFLDGLGARMFRPRVSRKSLLSTVAMRRYARNVLGDPLLEDLSIPTAVVATDVETQDEVVLRRGSSIAAVFASAAVPGVFPAVRLGNRMLVDGGVVNPVPASVVARMGAHIVIGVRLVHSAGTQADELSEERDGPIPSAVAAIMRSIELLQTHIATDSGSVPLILITPEFGLLPAGKLRHFQEGRRFVEAGEAAVEEALPRLTAALPWLRATDVDADALVAARR